MTAAEQAWPPPWTLKPTYGEPHDSESVDQCEGIGWDLSFGFRLNVDHDTAEDVNSPLTISAHYSDADLARGFVQREVRPDQLEEFARLLLNMAAKHKQRTRAVRPTCVCCGSAWPHVPSSERCTKAGEQA